MESPEVGAIAVAAPAPPVLDPAALVAQGRAEVRAGRVREGLAELGGVPTTDLGEVDRALRLAGLIDCLLARGDLSEAMALGDELSPLLEAEPLAAAIAHHARGTMTSALGDPVVALEHFLRAADLVPDPDLDLVPWPGGAALAHLRAGDPRAALVLTRSHVEAARRDARPHVLAHALRVQAVVDTGAGPVSTLQTARALLSPGVADLLAAQIDTDLAGLLLLGPHASEDLGAADALGLLRRAELVAGRQELWPLQSRIRRLLDVLGESPRRVDHEALAALTVSERRVARLAIGGLRNRQIAEELGVSVKAVEWHLSHVYRKLAITSRAQLALALGPLQPAG